MSRYVDYPADGTSVGRCVVLPGRQYTADGPLLFFATQTALARDWDVRQVWWEAPPRGSCSLADEVAWVSGQLDAALDGNEGRVFVVGKSLGTLAASRASACGYEAAWLTPLLTESAIADVLLTYPSRQFTVIGSSDPFLDEEVFETLPGERLLVAGDHVLRVPGNPTAMVASHGRFVRAFDAWLAAAQGLARRSVRYWSTRPKRAKQCQTCLIDCAGCRPARAASPMTLGVSSSASEPDRRCEDRGTQGRSTQEMLGIQDGTRSGNPIARPRPQHPCQRSKDQGRAL